MAQWRKKTADEVYSAAEIEARLKDELPAWYLEDGWIRRKYKTSSWKSTLMVVNTVGHLAEAAWHHPDLTVSYAFVTVKLMNHAAKGVTDKDFVIDLGSGDGRIVLTAAKVFGARGFGVEIQDKLVQLSNEAARREGIADRVKFITQDLFKTDISEATVLTMYLLPMINARLYPKLRGLKPGTRIVSHNYDISPEWKPDMKVTVGRSVVYLFTVPKR